MVDYVLGKTAKILNLILHATEKQHFACVMAAWNKLIIQFIIDLFDFVPVV